MKLFCFILKERNYKLYTFAYTVHIFLHKRHLHTYHIHVPSPTLYGQLNKVSIQSNKAYVESVDFVADEEASMNMYERAVYGYLSGQASAMIPATKTWPEFLWASCIELRVSWMCTQKEKVADNKLELCVCVIGMYACNVCALL